MIKKLKKALKKFKKQEAKFNKSFDRLEAITNKYLANM